MKSRLQRTTYLKETLRAAEEDHLNPRSYDLPYWRGSPHIPRRVVRVDADYLMYRVENSRTIRQQLAYLRSHPDLPKDLFDDPETSQAQEAQEAILIQMVEETGRGFLQDLGDRGQEEPVIIAYDGFIVNGNRRTAALRMLKVRYIECVILPTDAKPRDLYELEQVIQISQDFKEDYHWINELANISRGIRDKRFNYSEDEMAKRLRISKADIKAKLVMMDLVDSFLYWKEMPKAYDYSKLDDAEEIFRQLERGLRKYRVDDPKHRELMHAVFNLIEHRPATGRVYFYVTALIKDFDRVYERMKDTVQVSQVGDGETLYALQTGNDILAEILEETRAEYDELFSDSRQAPDISPILAEKIRDVKEENKERKDTEAVYDAVSAALRQLQGLVITSNTARLASIVSKLQEVQARADELLVQARAIGKG